LLATVQIMPDMTEVCLENTGSDSLREVQVACGGRSLGIISRLVPGEKKVLALAGRQEKLLVSALDSADRRIAGSIQYIPSESWDRSAASQNSASRPVSQPQSQLASAAGGGVLTVKSAPPYPLEINLSANRSEGRAGEIVGYRCTARNAGSEELSEIKIHCAGKMSSTKYLPPGEELILQGAFPINSSTTLIASAQARDGRGNAYSNNTTLSVWMKSSLLNLSVSHPRYAHRGESIPLQIRLENRGELDISGLTVHYGWGEEDTVGLLPAGGGRDLQKEVVAGPDMSVNVSATGRDEKGGQVFASCHPEIEVLTSSLQIEAEPASVNVYPGQPAEVAWILKNTGQEPLKDITLEGDGGQRILKEIPAGQAVRMAAIYTKSSTSWINVTARGRDARGFETADRAGVLIKAVSPGITIKLMPSDIETCPGEEAATNVLVTNTGDDLLRDVRLKLNGSLYSSMGDIEPGEFRVVTAKAAITGNCSLSFQAEGRDSLGRVQRDEAVAQVKAVVAALKIFAGASPAAVLPGESCRISCTVANTGKVPLYSIFVISKRMGPLGNIDFLSPKRQMTITAEKKITEGLQDVVTAEGFTEDRRPARATFDLNVGLLGSPEGSEAEPTTGSHYDLAISPVNITCGNLTFAFNLPEQEQTESQVSATIAADIDRAASRQSQGMLERIEGLFDYVERLLGLGREEGGQNEDDEAGASGEEMAAQANGSGSHAARQFGAKDVSPQGGYELSIEGVKGSEHGAITILDVNAQPSRPAAGEPVKITVHIQCPSAVKKASVKYGLSDLPLTRQDMLNVDRVYDCPLSLESGDAVDGYWSGTIPGRGAGVYMPLSVWIWDGASSVEGGPYLIHWSTVSSSGPSATPAAPSGGNGMLFIESTSVKGRGEVAIKDTIQGNTMHFNENIMGNGSISLETVRCIDRSSSVDNFTEKKDLVFTDGNIKGHQIVESPTFHGGMGAAVTERYNLTHVDRSETASVSSERSANNTLSFETEQAFNGTWNIQTKYAKFYKKIKADQQYTGSFQTQKEIKFADAGQRQ